MKSARLIQTVYGKPWNATIESWYALHQKVCSQAAPEMAPTSPLPLRPKFNLDGDPIAEMTIDGEGTATIPIIGTLAAGATPSEKFIYSLVAYEDIQADIAAARAAGAKGLRLLIDSPGGTVQGNYETAAAVADAAEEIPVIAQVIGMCCSAAYFIASGASAIIAPPSSIVGSIGTIYETQNVSEMLKNIGIEVNVFASGPFKGMGNVNKPLTDEQSTWIKSHVDYLATEFKSFVLQHRPNIQPSDMQGQYFTGKQAFAKGLIDATTRS